MIRRIQLFASAAAFIASAVVLLTGCSSLATKKAFYEPIVAELRQGRYDAVVAGIETAQKKKKYAHKDRFVYFIDAGLAYHYAGQFDSSNARLSSAEDAAEELFTRSISRAAASVVLNDNVLEYSGEDYEILYTNLVKAVNYISLHDFEDAFVEIRRANEKLNLLEQKYRQAAETLNEGKKDDSSRVEINYEADRVRFNNSAFARYLSMHMYAAEGKYDDAVLDFDLMRRAFIEQPHVYSFTVPEIKYRAGDSAIVSVMALIGTAPVKEALNLYLRTDSDLDLVQILYDDPNRPNAEYAHIPTPVSKDYFFKFSIPQITAAPSLIGEIRVYIDECPVGSLQIIEDIRSVAEETFRAKKSLILLRTVARSVAKGLVAEGVKDDVKSKGVGGWLKKLAVDALVAVTENADLRCSRLLPGKILIGDFAVPPGPHDIRLEFCDQGGTIIQSQSFPNVQAAAAEFNAIEAILPR